MSIEENKELVRRYTSEVFDEGNVAAVDEYLAPDFYNHVTGKTGTEDFKQLATDVGQAPGTGNVIEFLIAEDDLVVAFMTITRTLHKELRVRATMLQATGVSTIPTLVIDEHVFSGEEEIITALNERFSEPIDAARHRYKAKEEWREWMRLAGPDA